MSSHIPTYQLNILTENEGDLPDFFFLNKNLAPLVRIDIPYRRDFYAVGICLRGSAGLKVDLETYLLEPDCLVIKPPQTINQWTFRSADFESLTIFFTREFAMTDSSSNPDNFRFFEAIARHVFPATAAQKEVIVAALQNLKQKYDTPHPYRKEILRNLVNILLYEIASIYERNAAPAPLPTRSGLLAAEFKKLLGAHFLSERNLGFYAGKLMITPKHLTETIRETTGKTAGEWIAETVVLEAKVLLQNPALSIERISDTLHFPDQSTFGKFFKNQTGLSPSAYKRTL